MLLRSNIQKEFDELFIYLSDKIESRFIDIYEIENRINRFIQSIPSGNTQLFYFDELIRNIIIELQSYVESDGNIRLYDIETKLFWLNGDIEKKIDDYSGENCLEILRSCFTIFEQMGFNYTRSIIETIENSGAGVVNCIIKELYHLNIADLFNPQHSILEVDTNPKNNFHNNTLEPYYQFQKGKEDNKGDYFKTEKIGRAHV